MNAFLYLFSDHVWLPLLEFFIVAFFIRAVLYDIKVFLRPGNPLAEVKRGEKSWTILLSFWAIAIIIIEIIISSDLISEHRVIVGLLNFIVLLYLNLFSGYFKNKIIGWSSRIQNRLERV
jgi:hypothetical protein